LSASANYVMSNGSVLTLRRSGTVWREVSRTTI
jgi:hypothetical protein